MKKKCFLALFGTLCIGAVVYLTLESVLIEKTMTHVARPSRPFNPKLIESHFAPKKEWEIKETPDHDKFFYLVCQQTLSWLGRGMQAVVFETQDEKYVVKLFQLGRLREDDSRGSVEQLLSGESKEKRQERIQHREEIFSSSKLCYEELQEETGIVYVHLNRSKELIHTIRLVDKYGESHLIRGDDTSFLIQKKASYLVPTITAHMEQGEVEQAKARVDQIFDLLLSLAKKGFVDGDDALIRNNNLGLTKDRAIYIDTGHLFRASNLDIAERMRYEFEVRLDPLEKWLNVAYPDLGVHYRASRERIMSSLRSQNGGKAISG